MIDPPEDASCRNMGQSLKDSALLSRESPLMQALRNGADATITRELGPILSHFSQTVGAECVCIKFSDQSPPSLDRLASSQFDSDQFSKVMQLSVENKDKVLTMQLGVMSQLLSFISSLAHVECHARVIKAKPDMDWSEMWTKETVELFRRMRTWRATLTQSLAPDRTMTCFEQIPRAAHVDVLDGAVKLKELSDNLHKAAGEYEALFKDVFTKQATDLLSKLRDASPGKWRACRDEFIKDRDACMELAEWPKEKLALIGPLSSTAREMSKIVKFFHSDGHAPVVDLQVVKSLGAAANAGVETFCFCFAAWHLVKGISSDQPSEKVQGQVDAVKDKFTVHKVILESILPLASFSVVLALGLLVLPACPRSLARPLPPCQPASPPSSSTSSSPTSASDSQCPTCSVALVVVESRASGEVKMPEPLEKLLDDLRNGEAQAFEALKFAEPPAVLPAPAPGPPAAPPPPPAEAAPPAAPAAPGPSAVGSKRPPEGEARASLASKLKARKLGGAAA